MNEYYILFSCVYYLFAGLTIYDGLTTIYAVQLAGPDAELNPLMKKIIQKYGINGIKWAKVLQMVILPFLLCPDLLINIFVFSVADILYLCVVCNNVLQIQKYKTYVDV